MNHLSLQLAAQVTTATLILGLAGKLTLVAAEKTTTWIGKLIYPIHNSSQDLDYDYFQPCNSSLRICQSRYEKRHAVINGVARILMFSTAVITGLVIGTTAGMTLSLAFSGKFITPYLGLAGATIPVATIVAAIADPKILNFFS